MPSTPISRTAPKDPARTRSPRGKDEKALALAPVPAPPAPDLGFADLANMLVGMEAKIDRLSNLETKVTTMSHDISAVRSEIATVRNQISDEFLTMQKDIYDMKNDQVILEHRVDELLHGGGADSMIEPCPGKSNALAIAAVELSKQSNADQVILSNWPTENSSKREAEVQKALKSAGSKVKPKFTFHGPRFCRVQFDTTTEASRFRALWKQKRIKVEDKPIYVGFVHTKGVNSLTRPLTMKLKELRGQEISAHVDWRDLTIKDGTGNNLFLLNNEGILLAMSTPEVDVQM